MNKGNKLYEGKAKIIYETKIKFNYSAFQRWCDCL